MMHPGTGFPAEFAPSERDSMDRVKSMVRQLRDEPLIQWFDVMPTPVLAINRNRQIIFGNKAFCDITLRADCSEILGLRPGEALHCVHSDEVSEGCGHSGFCAVCGAAKAILKSLAGLAYCQECRMLRMDNGTAVPLDLQIFTRPVNFRDTSLIAVFALDISYEKRLNYLNRTFHHSLVNGVGGINALADLFDADQDNASILGLLADSTRRTLKEVLYHRDIAAAEDGRLAVNLENFDATAFLNALVKEECRLRNTPHSFTEVESSCTSLRSDKRILGHVLGNMLKNALEAREETPGKILLTCSKLEDGTTTISMRNPGTIPPDIQKQLFKRYVSTKSRDRGLGIYVMKLFTEQSLGGEIFFSSGNNETSFSITLPSNGQ